MHSIPHLLYHTSYLTHLLFQTTLTYITYHILSLTSHITFSLLHHLHHHHTITLISSQPPPGLIPIWVRYRVMRTVVNPLTTTTATTTTTTTRYSSVWCHLRAFPSPSIRWRSISNHNLCYCWYYSIMVYAALPAFSTHQSYHLLSVITSSFHLLSPASQS